MIQPFEIFAAVEKETGLSKSRITGRCRSRRLVEARRRFIALALEEGYSLSAIGRHLKRDHTTICYHVNGEAHNVHPCV